jgi:urease gamma subunit
MKSIQGIHNYVKTNLSLDLWTINLLLLGFVAGPSIYNAMKNSPHTEDDYMFSIPVDDPVEHSVRILMELSDESVSTSADSEEKSTIKSTFNNPEDDAKRILNDMLASENLRTTASRIASGVIQSPPFQNACKALVYNIWNDLVNDPETKNQLVALVQSVLQNEKIYKAVKEMMIKLINDEEVYKELTKLIVQLGEEGDVMDATQRLLTESAHKTLNDPSVLDHSMEFATEVVGDDVVQRSGGEALRNTAMYAVQPSGGAIFAGISTMLIAGAIHFYFFRGNADERYMSHNSSFDSWDLVIVMVD